ncbi:MAG: AAA family ATPase [Muribaculaceae bacterium]|nr:AAA family ATPase [Muribaculaceae bacterium]
MVSKKFLFVGRETQLTELRKVLNSDNPEFVVVYGRRRVGKTLLIKEAAKNEFTFAFTAADNITKLQQLANFASQLSKQFNTASQFSFKTWFEAFFQLGELLESLPEDQNKIIFLDEIPWADTPKSYFLQALENLWNTRCAFHNDIKLVVCGSATFWILNKIIGNRGGLYGRITHQFKIEPFNLYESSLYFKERGFKYSKKDIADIYMVTGGIPYYFSLMKTELSVVQNIDYLFFAANAPLVKEFNYLYSSIYKKPAIYLDVVKQLASVGKGMTRQELIKNLNINGNGGFSNVLRELEECGFIRAYLPFEISTRKKTSKNSQYTLYQLIDLYSLFYLRFFNEHKYYNENFWSVNFRTPSLNTWRGISFEKVCLWHIPQIKEALGIAGVDVRVCSWIGKFDGEKAQIDLIIERKDNVMNICEMKYSADKYVITKKYAEEFEHKLNIFLEATHNRKTPVITFITTNGVKANAYSSLVQKQIELQQLFKY